ncbi:MAG: segregation/condensation protein A [Clostridia bacterium]|nr:segregation/condensation protein A [Clostridia bacterium]
MAFNVENFESVVDYNTVLDDFEGPLDLLLHLINIAQIKIEDVFVSKVTEQFLDYIEFMKSQPHRDVDKESEYLAMAAQIIYIKSKSMLPVVEVDGEDMGGDEDEKQALIEQLKQREYELIKGETPKLKDLETVGYVFKEPDPSLNTVRVVYKDFTVNALLEAFAKMMLKNESLQREKEKVREIPKDVYTVEEKVAYIRERLISEKSVKFESLFTVFSKNEVVTTFQALLEMLKHQFILVRQEYTFAEIEISLNPDWDLKDVINEQFDEYN